MYSSCLVAFRRRDVTIPDTAKLILIAVGDEQGEPGAYFANSMTANGYVPDAIALIVSTAGHRGHTVHDAAIELMVPYSEVTVDQFDDPYQVTRVLATLMEAPVARGVVPWLERVLATPILTKP